MTWSRIGFPYAEAVSCKFFKKAVPIPTFLYSGSRDKSISLISCGDSCSPPIKGFQLNTYSSKTILTTTDLRRSLVQMKLAGWFENCSGLMFGRSEANQTVDNYTVEDIYKELFEELQIPIIYDIDCGHVPPQITFINGAYAEVEVEDGKASVIQYFIP